MDQAQGRGDVHMLVAVPGRMEAASLIRTAAQMARRRGDRWRAVHVETARRPTPPAVLESLSHQVAHLGGEWCLLSGERVIDELADHARRSHADTLVIGRAAPSFRLWPRADIGHRLMSALETLDIVVVAGRPAPRRGRWPHWPRLTRREGYWPLASVGLALVVAWLVAQKMDLANLSLIFLGAVLVTALAAGARAAMLAAALSALAYNFFFTSPRFSLEMIEHGELSTVGLFLLVALIGGQLGGALRRRMMALRESRHQIRQLLITARALSAAPDRAGIRDIIVSTVSRDRSLPCAFLECKGADVIPTLSAAHPGELVLEGLVMEAATWSYHHGEPSGAGSAMFSDLRWRMVPLTDASGVLGVIAMAIDERREGRAREEPVLLDTLFRLFAAALTRVTLVEALNDARLAEGNERLRAALLSSVSHDLRTPLASIIGSASSLRDLDDSLNREDRQELLEAVLGESERLDRYIQNLLDMTRLGHGLSIKRDWVAAGDLFEGALTRLGRALNRVHVVRSWDDDLPLLHVHAALIEQALVNILENAIRLSPEHGQITLAGHTDGDQVCLCVHDEGPGVPEALRERIFERFFTGEQADSGPHGSGLGLTICRSMVRAHGGDVHVEAGPNGQGATFVIRLARTETPEAFDHDD
ncbi:two-component system, OmpR family, sensor histidine kinase KdpD [Kushneria avicenniae]|uniref:histidine kinase n=1 Tax=Kushneria avicenniae TaxID=402385 RepID=A0A1I1M1K5_9GAMM|nr:ATP-binding protein [Kushneria avicenniae]SFC79397.1 two-component system, OmpR family, sensor histidine kinase KdpD [Kushneria avicenniae]